MDLQEARLFLQNLESDEIIQNFIAQGKSRYILFNVEELQQNFPDYTSRLSERLNQIAFSYLTVGCYLAEGESILEAIGSLKKGAELLEFNHKPIENRELHSKYYILASSIAFYSAYEYSRAFVILKEVEIETPLGKLFAFFLRKDFDSLSKHITSILIDSNYIPQRINITDEEESDINTKVWTFLCAKSIAYILDYFFTGNEDSLNMSKEILSDLLDLLQVEKEPSLWWCIRLFKIITGGLNRSSLWMILPPFFPSRQNLQVGAFIKSLAFRKPIPVVELFISQRNAAKKVLESSSLVVCLPTSSGKTRVAEIAIFNALIENDESIILYIAPFKSLAFEVEQTLDRTFTNLGFQISHIYGGSQFTKIDEMLIQGSRILIVTPEKAKAIIRGNEELANKIKLVIIDEGHLLGNTDRLISIEMFYEELRHHIESNSGRFLVLSAVLPNAEDIAEWVSHNKDSVIRDDWRPSTRRLGTLEFTGRGVNLNWRNEEPETWNYNFVNQTPILGTENNVFPNSKEQAIAATAVKLCKNGSVLIFMARTNLILSLAREVLYAIDEAQLEHVWENEKVWESYYLSAKQAFGEDHEYVILAKKGILCHHGKLPQEVKIHLERLMRDGNPNVIISTTTLAQGVNLGVSTVIIGDVWLEKPWDYSKRISIADFWNIVGRAGRAFIDSEGKVLFAIDQSKEGWKNNSEKELANYYLNAVTYNPVQSGILQMIVDLEVISNEYDIKLDLLLQLIAENYEDVDDCPISKTEFDGLQSKLDLIDDTLLALDYKKVSISDSDPSEWIDNFFRQSLAYIQARNNADYNAEPLLRYLKERNKLIMEQAGEFQNWKNFINTGMPFRASLKLKNLIPNFINIFEKFSITEKNIGDYITALSEVEVLMNSLPNDKFQCLHPKSSAAAKRLWLSGASYFEIEKELGVKKADYFCSKYFGFTVPWVLNAVAKGLLNLELIDKSEFYEYLAVITELGLPNVLSAKVFLCGVSSRVSAFEISTHLDIGLESESLDTIKDTIIEQKNLLKDLCSSDTQQWLNIFTIQKISNEVDISKFPLFIIAKVKTDKLYFRENLDSLYLSSNDYSEFVKVREDKRDLFKGIDQNNGYYLERVPTTDKWKVIKG